MKKTVIALAVAAAAANVHAQSLPNPKFSNLTITGAPHRSCPSIMDSGGDNTNTNDNSTAFATTAALGPSGLACVYFPPGTYKFTSQLSYTLPSSTAAITIQGAGADVTKLVWAAGGGLKLNYAGQYNSAHIRNLSVLTGTTATGSGIYLNQTAGSITDPANGPFSDITNVTIRGSDGYAATDYWSNAINIVGVSNVNLFGVNITGAAATYATVGYGVQFSGSSAVPAVVLNITDSIIDNVYAAVNYGAYAQGILISQSNFTGDDYGVLVGSSLAGLDQLTVMGSQFNCGLQGILDQTGVPSTMVQGNLFIVPNTGVGIQVLTATEFSFMGNSFNINGSKGGTFPVGMVITSSTTGYSGIITGNQFNSMTTGVLLQTSSHGVNLQSNSYSNNSTNITNSANSGTSVCPATSSANCVGTAATP